MSEIKFELNKTDKFVKFISEPSEPIVEIKPNGDVIVNPKYTVTEAARLFWNEFVKVNPINRANGWRRVEDGLPEESGAYLVTMSDGEKREVTKRRFSVDMPFKKWEFSDAISNWKVIAWMPEPEPFEE